MGVDSGSRMDLVEENDSLIAPIFYEYSIRQCDELMRGCI